MSITDQQLPMVIRLVELIIAIVDGTLILPESTEVNSNESSMNYLSNNISPVTESALRKPSENSTELLSENLEDFNKEQAEKDGWISWAWSYVPAVLGD